MLVVFGLECSLFSLEHSKYMVKSFFCVDENCLEWSKQQKGGGGSESNIIIKVINKDDRSFFYKIRTKCGEVSW